MLSLSGVILTISEPVFEIAPPYPQGAIGETDAARSTPFLPPVVESRSSDLQLGADLINGQLLTGSDRYCHEPLAASQRSEVTCRRMGRFPCGE